MNTLPTDLLLKILNLVPNTRILLKTGLRSAELNRRQAVRTALINQILQSNLKNKVTLFTIPLAHPIFNAKKVELANKVNREVPNHIQARYLNNVSNKNKINATAVYYLIGETPHLRNPPPPYAVLATGYRLLGTRNPRTKRY
jgi:hypothetical protein